MRRVQSSTRRNAAESRLPRKSFLLVASPFRSNKLIRLSLRYRTDLMGVEPEGKTLVVPILVECLLASSIQCWCSCEDLPPIPYCFPDQASWRWTELKVFRRLSFDTLSETVPDGLVGAGGKVRREHLMKKISSPGEQEDCKGCGEVFLSRTN